MSEKQISRIQINKITLEPAPPLEEPTSIPHPELALRAPEINQGLRITDISEKHNFEDGVTTKDPHHTIQVTSK